MAVNNSGASGERDGWNPTGELIKRHLQLSESYLQMAMYELKDALFALSLAPSQLSDTERRQLLSQVALISVRITELIGVSKVAKDGSLLPTPTENNSSGSKQGPERPDDT